MRSLHFWSSFTSVLFRCVAFRFSLRIFCLIPRNNIQKSTHIQKHSRTEMHKERQAKIVLLFRAHVHVLKKHHVVWLSETNSIDLLFCTVFLLSPPVIYELQYAWICVCVHMSFVRITHTLTLCSEVCGWKNNSQTICVFNFCNERNRKDVSIFAKIQNICFGHPLTKNSIKCWRKCAVFKQNFKFHEFEFICFHLLIIYYTCDC